MKIPIVAPRMKTAFRHLPVFVLIVACAGSAQRTGWAQPPPSTSPGNGPSLENYRKYALTHDGDAANGARLFADEQKLACTKCHSVDGRGGKAGPDLLAAGDKFGRGDLIDAMLRPSATIAVGYTTTIVETKAGVEYQGIIKQANATGIQLMGADGKLVSLATGDIRQQRGSSVSLMPEGLQSGLTLKEFTDLVDYLVTLRQPETALASNHAMPSLIPEITTPVTARPFFSQELRLPRSKAETGLTAIHQVPGLTNVFLVLHQKGMIWMMEKTAAGDARSVFLDLTLEAFSDRGPNGLLGLTFHPKFRENRKYYLKHQVLAEGKVTTLLVERQFAVDLRHDSGLPGRRLLAIQSVAEDHSGG